MPMPDRILTKDEFHKLPPFVRGYIVRFVEFYGGQPNVPREKNPYPNGSVQAKEWQDGWTQAGNDRRE